MKNTAHEIARIARAEIPGLLTRYDVKNAEDVLNGLAPVNSKIMRRAEEIAIQKFVERYVRQNGITSMHELALVDTYVRRLFGSRDYTLREIVSEALRTSTPYKSKEVSKSKEVRVKSSTIVAKTKEAFDALYPLVMLDSSKPLARVGRKLIYADGEVRVEITPDSVELKGNYSFGNPVRISENTPPKKLRLETFILDVMNTAEMYGDKKTLERIDRQLGRVKHSYNGRGEQTAEIRSEPPKWDLIDDGLKNGESPFRILEMDLSLPEEKEPGSEFIVPHSVAGFLYEPTKPREWLKPWKIWGTADALPKIAFEALTRIDPNTESISGKRSRYDIIEEEGRKTVIDPMANPVTTKGMYLGKEGKLYPWDPGKKTIEGIKDLEKYPEFTGRVLLTSTPTELVIHSDMNSSEGREPIFDFLNSINGTRQIRRVLALHPQSYYSVPLATETYLPHYCETKSLRTDRRGLSTVAKGLALLVPIAIGAIGSYYYYYIYLPEQRRKPFVTVGLTKDQADEFMKIFPQQNGNQTWVAFAQDWKKDSSYTKQLFELTSFARFSLLNADPDEDGLTNEQEKILKLDPLRLSLGYDLNEVDDSLGILAPELLALRKSFDQKTQLNISSALSKIQSYRTIQLAIRDHFGNITLYSRNQTRFKELIREWNRSHSVVNDKNDKLGEKSLSWYMKEKIRSLILEYNKSGNNTYLSLCKLLAEEGIGSADRLESVTHTGQLVYDNILLNRDLRKRYAELKLSSEFYRPGFIGELEANGSMGGVIRQLNLELSPSENDVKMLGRIVDGIKGWAIIHPLQRGRFELVRSYLSPDIQKILAEIIDKDKSEYGPIGINHMLDRVIGYEKECAQVITNGIKVKEITNIPSLGLVTNDKVAVSHIGGNSDKYYHKNFSLLPQNHEQLSNLELYYRVLSGLPRLSYPKFAAVLSTKLAWESGEADCFGYTMLVNAAGSLAGRRTFSIVVYDLIDLYHAASVIEQDNRLYVVDGITRRGPELLTPTKVPQIFSNLRGLGTPRVCQIFYPFLGGTLTRVVYLPDGTITLPIPK
jgi:hypothetical protein